MQRDSKQAYSVQLMVSNVVFHLYGCVEWSIFFVRRIIDKKRFEFVCEYFHMPLSIAKQLNWHHGRHGYP